MNLASYALNLDRLFGRRPCGPPPDGNGVKAFARIPDIGALLDRRCQRLSNNARRDAFDLGDIEVTLKRGEKPKCAFGIGEAISDLSPLHGVGPTDAICICRFRRFESLLVWSH